MSHFQAGCRSVVVAAPALEESIAVLAFYPSLTDERAESLGPFPIDVAMSAPVAGGPFPVVLISHGTGSRHTLHRALGRHLAHNGFVALLVEHPRNNRDQNDLAGTATILFNRPRHLRAVLDWAYSSEIFRNSIVSGSAAVIGHSLGGYTALALAGGKPRTLPGESSDGRICDIDVTPDSRIKALVLLAPATVWFQAPGALDAVRLPILMFTGGQDPHTPPFHAEVILRGVPDAQAIEHRVIANAGHFSFLSPYPKAMISPALPPSQDPPGFDREAFHRQMNLDVASFLGRVLAVD